MVWQGAPAHLTANINPSKCLANGTQVILHSLLLPHDANIGAINAQNATATPGSIIALDCTPTTVNVTIPNISINDWSDSQSLVPGEVVIPLKLSLSLSLSLSYAMALLCQSSQPSPYFVFFSLFIPYLITNPNKFLSIGEPSDFDSI